MLRKILLTALLLLPLPALAQTLDGDWNGTMQLPNRQLRLLFQFHTAIGQTTTDVTSVDQTSTALRAASTALTGHQLLVTLPNLNSSYQGTLDDAGKTITGSWTQNGHVLPLNLKPGSIAPLKPPRTPEAGDLTIAAYGGTLAGTIRKAGDGKIGAVIINGSGPADRNGESATSNGPGTYRLLADALAAQGISTLRFDKRGIGESMSAAGPESSLRVQMYVDDTKSWAAELKRRLGTRCVWLIGHSEGALLAEMAAQDSTDVCGLVLLAGPGRKLGDVLHEQLERNLPERLKPRAFAMLTSLEAGQQVADPPLEMMDLFRPSIQPYLISEFMLDPAALLAKLKLPVLILQGDADMNVSVADAKALAAARPGATLKIMSGVNHRQRLEKDPSPAPLAPGLTDTIAGFLKAHP